MVLADIRKISNIPVIIVSAKETTQNKIDLLRLGADDYMTKPFDLEEVLARIESNIRRAGFGRDSGNTLEYNGLTIDENNNLATLDGTELSLTAKEFAILLMLLKYPNKVFSKANLFESIWKEEYIAEDNALNVHVSNLRAKLKNISPEKDFIDTVWGIGYRLHKD
jgi:DNA-binding response OmpR family regulator